MPSPASEETVDEPAWAEPAAPLEAASVVELEAAAEEVAAAELAELVAAARLKSGGGGGGARSPIDIEEASRAVGSRLVGFSCEAEHGG